MALESIKGRVTEGGEQETYYYIYSGSPNWDLFWQDHPVDLMLLKQISKKWRGDERNILKKDDMPCEINVGKQEEYNRVRVSLLYGMRGRKKDGRA